jgi:hypothetical protein
VARDDSITDNQTKCSLTQSPEVVSIPIARSISLDDPVGLPRKLNLPETNGKRAELKVFLLTTISSRLP